MIQQKSKLNKKKCLARTHAHSRKQTRTHTGIDKIKQIPNKPEPIKVQSVNGLRRE